MRCRVANVAVLACDFTGEGDDALEDATAKAAVADLVQRHLLFERHGDEQGVPRPVSLSCSRTPAASAGASATTTRRLTSYGRNGRSARHARLPDRWEYLDAAGVWGRGNDRDDAAEKALKKGASGTVRRMEELEKNLRAYDVKYGNATDGLPPRAPPFLPNRDNRDGRASTRNVWRRKACRLRGLRDAYAVDATPARRRRGGAVAVVRWTRRRLRWTRAPRGTSDL